MNPGENWRDLARNSGRMRARVASVLARLVDIERAIVRTGGSSPGAELSRAVLVGDLHRAWRDLGFAERDREDAAVSARIAYATSRRSVVRSRLPTDPQ